MNLKFDIDLNCQITVDIKCAEFIGYKWISDISQKESDLVNPETYKEYGDFSEYENIVAGKLFIAYNVDYSAWYDIDSPLPDVPPFSTDIRGLDILEKYIIGNKGMAMDRRQMMEVYSNICGNHGWDSSYPQILAILNIPWEERFWGLYNNIINDDRHKTWQRIVQTKKI